MYVPFSLLFPPLHSPAASISSEPDFHPACFQGFLPNVLLSQSTGTKLGAELELMPP